MLESCEGIFPKDGQSFEGVPDGQANCEKDAKTSLLSTYV